MFLNLYGQGILCDDRHLAVVIKKHAKLRAGGTIEVFERTKNFLWQMKMLVQLVHNQHSILVCLLKIRLDALTVTLDWLGLCNLWDIAQDIIITNTIAFEAVREPTLGIRLAYVAVLVLDPEPSAKSRPQLITHRSSSARSRTLSFTPRLNLR